MKTTATKTETKEVPANLFIPSKNPNFIPFGCSVDVLKIVQSEMFFPTYITGLSGNGKTFMVEQICADANRELFRVSINSETDEESLLGGFRLKDGSTVWEDGPVVQAMERGAILLLDELDLGTHKLMCLQPILEGNPVLLKRISRLVTPKKGFNIIATANTKGKGDEGQFVGTNIMNEAMLDRFLITFEHEYPSKTIESNILLGLFGKNATEENKAFVANLTVWAEKIRKTYIEGGISEIITTRRLIGIVQSFLIFGKKYKAVEIGVSRFDTETKTTMLTFYNTIDPISDGKNTDPKVMRSF